MASGNRSLAGLVEGIRRYGFFASCAVLFGSAAVALALQASTANALNLLMLLLPLALAVGGIIAARGIARGLIVTGAALLLLLAILLLPPGILWPPIASLAFAMSLIAVCSLPTAAALLAMLLGSLLTYYGATMAEPRTLLISTALLDGWVTPLSTFTLSLGLLVILRAWQARAEQADAASVEVRERTREIAIGDEVDAARRAVDRRLHETVLNTLVAMSATHGDAAAVRRQCAADLAAAERPAGPISSELAGIVAEASALVPNVTVVADPIPNATLDDARAARVVRDALVELLRNVERHSGQLEARITCTLGSGSVELLVEDAGQGMAEPMPRFGLRNAVLAAVGSIGGSVAITGREPTGTRVVLRLPIGRRLSQLRPPTALTVLLGSTLGRLALSPTLLLGLIAVPFAAASFRQPWTIIGLFTLLVAAAALLALRWEPNRRWPAGLAVIMLALGTMGAAGLLQQGCETAVSMHWVIYAAAGGVSLAILSARSIIGQLLLLAAVIAASVAVALTAPATCRLDAMDAALENAAWLTLLILVVSLLARSLDRRLADESRMWDELVFAQAAIAAREAEDSRWRSVNDGTWSLLRGVADGSLDPSAAEVRSRARLEEARLRALLDISACSSEALRGDLECLVGIVHGAGCPVSVHVLDAAPHAHLRSTMAAEVSALVATQVGDPVQLTVLPHALLLTLRHIDGAASGTVLEVLPDGRSVVSLPR